VPSSHSIVQNRDVEGDQFHRKAYPFLVGFLDRLLILIWLIQIDSPTIFGFLEVLVESILPYKTCSDVSD
jgi:hypothetical protein